MTDTENQGYWGVKRNAVWNEKTSTWEEFDIVKLPFRKKHWIMAALYDTVILPFVKLFR